MRNRIFQFLQYALAICFATFLLKTCLPKHYHVPQLQVRAGTQYWDLPTGSRIGYVLIPAKGAKKPYPVIYLHGGPGGPIYDRNISLLSPLAEDGYDVYLYDQIGGGQSARLTDIREYTADRHVRDLAEIVKKTSAAKVILLGQSWGAMLAVLFTADHPEAVDKIIFTGPGPIPPVHRELAQLPGPDSLHLRVPDYSNAEANKHAATWRSEAVERYAYWFGKKLASDEEMDEFATYLNTGLRKSTVCDTLKLSTLTEGGGGYYAQIMTMQSLLQVQDPRPKLKETAVPVLIMKGQCDNQKWGFTQEYLQLFPKQELVVVPNAGHAIAVEQPEIYLQTIRPFLNK
ncbi:MAG: alpha/beta hydrolase [Saprospiraceae bacterium]